MAQNNEFLQAALERLKKEAGAVSGQKEKAMAGAVRKALENFCRQEPEFAQAIVQGFAPDYIIDFVDPSTGKDYSKAAKVARVGNSVSPPMAEAVVRANLPEWCGRKIGTMAEFKKIVSA